MTNEEARAWLTVYAMLWPTGVVMTEKQAEKAKKAAKNPYPICEDEKLSRRVGVDLESFNKIIWAMAVSDAL